MAKSIFIDATEIAQLLEFDTKMMFLHRRKDMEAEGFPRPVSFIRKPLRWRRDDVLAWRDGIGRSLPGIPAPQTPSDNRKIVMLHAAGRA